MQVKFTLDGILAPFSKTSIFADVSNVGALITSLQNAYHQFIVALFVERIISKQNALLQLTTASFAANLARLNVDYGKQQQSTSPVAALSDCHVELTPHVLCEIPSTDLTTDSPLATASNVNTKCSYYSIIGFKIKYLKRQVSIKCPSF